MKIKEITIISDFEDKPFDILLKQRYEDRKDTLFPITKIKSIIVLGDNWPLNYQFNRFYFLNDNNPIGYASIAYVRNKDIKNLYSIKMIYIKSNFRRQNFISSFYSFLLDNGYNLISDNDQTKSSKMVWKKLLGKYKLYLTDINESPIKEIITLKDFEMAYGPNNKYKIIAIK